MKLNEREKEIIKRVFSEPVSKLAKYKNEKFRDKPTQANQCYHEYNKLIKKLLKS